jgi:nuclear factor I, invertebrate
LAIQRYATHPVPRLVGQSRQDEVLLHQQQQQHSALVQQAVSPEGTVFYQHQHSPSASDVHVTDNHHSPEDADEITTVSSRKYSECQTNGHDTLSDFVTFVCQETEQSGGNQNHRNSPKSQQYSNYNTLPPMLPPLAIPVAIRSSDLTSLPPTSITPPNSSPHHKHQESHMGHTDVNQSPPLSPQSQMDRKGLTRISSPYSNGRDYTFNHFHTQQPQVRFRVNANSNSSILNA